MRRRKVYSHFGIDSIVNRKWCQWLKTDEAKGYGAYSSKYATIFFKSLDIKLLIQYTKFVNENTRNKDNEVLNTIREAFNQIDIPIEYKLEVLLLTNY